MLTNAAVRQAKPRETAYKLADEKGLYLHIMPGGARYWRLKFRFNGKEKLLAFGAYPEVSVAEARDKRDAARKLLLNGVDPSAARRTKKLQDRMMVADTFGLLADEFLKVKCSKLAESTISKKKQILDNNLRPWLGTRPVKEITAPELLAVIRRVESRGANELAHRSLQLAGQVFRYGVATGRAERSPAGDLHGALVPVVTEHHAAITEPKKVGELLRALDGYTGTFAVKCALLLAPMLFVRPGELRQAEWSEIDLDGAEWNIPGAKMKMKVAHLVPLSTQAVTILRELHPLTGRGQYVFPSMRTGERPMSENTVNAALRRLGFANDEMVGHGFRALARTILDEVLKTRVDLIEHQLAHAVKDANGRAYNRTSHLPERREMMQQWADFLDKLKAGAEVIQLHGGKAA